MARCSSLSVTNVNCWPLTVRTCQRSPVSSAPSGRSGAAHFELVAAVGASHRRPATADERVVELVLGFAPLALNVHRRGAFPREDRRAPDYTRDPPKSIRPLVTRSSRDLMKAARGVRAQEGPRPRTAAQLGRACLRRATADDGAFVNHGAHRRTRRHDRTLVFPPAPRRGDRALERG